MTEPTPYREVIEGLTNQDFFMTKICPARVKKYLKVSFPSSDKNGKKLRGFPTYGFIKDRFLPCFSLQVDKEIQIERRSAYYAAHCERKQQALKERKRMYVPRPVSKSLVCAVCRQKYEDYIEVLNKTISAFRISSNAFKQYIEDLCDVVNPDWKRGRQNAIESEEIALQKKSRKMRKTSIIRQQKTQSTYKQASSTSSPIHIVTKPFLT